MQRCPDITKAKQILDWTPVVDLKAGLSRTIAYFDRLLAEHGGRAPTYSAPTPVATAI
jgi:UDP-glucuronate decarboxylase